MPVQILIVTKLHRLIANVDRAKNNIECHSVRQTVYTE